MTSTSRFTKKSTNGFRSSLTSLEGQLLSNRLSEFNFGRDIFFPGSCSYLLHLEDYLLRFWMWFLLFFPWFLLLSLASWRLPFEVLVVFFLLFRSWGLIFFFPQTCHLHFQISNFNFWGRNQIYSRYPCQLIPVDLTQNFPFSKHNFNHLLEENLNMDFYASSIVRHINSTALNYWKYCWRSTRFICSWAASPYREIHSLN